MEVLKTISHQFGIKTPFIIVLTFLFFLSCTNENTIPTKYDGYALLKTKRLPLDGLGLYTFIHLQNGNSFENAEDYAQYLSDQSVTFLFSSADEFLEYKRQLNQKGWDTNDALVLVKVNYEIFTSDWLKEVNQNTFSLSMNGKEYPIHDFAFEFPTNAKGENLYQVKNMELIKKIN